MMWRWCLLTLIMKYCTLLYVHCKHRSAVWHYDWVESCKKCKMGHWQSHFSYSFSDMSARIWRMKNTCLEDCHRYDYLERITIWNESTMTLNKLTSAYSHVSKLDQTHLLFFRLQALLNYMKSEDYGIMVKDPCRWISPIWILVFLQRVLMLKVIFIGIIITIIQWLISIFIIWPNLFVQWVMICMSLMYDERVNKRKRKKLCCSGWKKIRFWKFKTTLFRIGGPWTAWLTWVACQKFDLTYYRVFYLYRLLFTGPLCNQK